ncbi:hypothetical protein IWQ61_002919 [Dispira simplex]|nr:hypothetical protein IWQ61_002919 [Dispira simplex]
MESRDEITTIFVVGFPEDMQEREFQNMFTFSPEFEAATLKIPPSGNSSDGDETVSTSRKQIIGFAKFRTRMAAMEARGVLNGRKVDAERNCLLKAEMAKKNLHTRRGLASSNLTNGSTTALSSGGGGTLGMGGSTSTSLNPLASQDSFHLPHPHPHSHSHHHNDTSPTSRGFPQLTTAHLNKIFDPFSASAPVTPIGTSQTPHGLGSDNITTAADFFPSNDSSLFDLYRDPSGLLPSVDMPTSYLQRRNSVHHSILSNDSALGTSAPVTRPPIGFGLSKAQSERRNTNPASLSQIEQIFGTSNTSTTSGGGPLFNKNLDLGGLGNRLSGLSLGATGSLPPVSVNGSAVGVPINMSMSKSSVFPASSSLPNGLPMSAATRSAHTNDHNPPCNTLYVGNLAASTQEDELRGLFAKAAGYKRLYFRPKQNMGPICFVEFEDIAHATQAMHQLNGCTISSSPNGGIRLSFSKNPLGVRQQSNGNSSNGSGNGAYSLKTSHTPPISTSMSSGLHGSHHLTSHSSVGSGMFGSSLGSRHTPPTGSLDPSLMEPTSAAIH